MKKRFLLRRVYLEASLEELRQNHWLQFGQLLFLLILTSMVGLGYVFKRLSHKLIS